MKFLLFSLLLFISINTLGQEKKSFVALQSGVSIPVGDYGATNLDYSCFTITGLNFNVEGAWFFMNHLGVGGQVGIDIHPVDVQTLGWEKLLANPFLEDLTIRSDSYQMISTMIGLYSQWGFWKKFSVQGKILGGMMWAKSPYQLYKPIYFLVEPKWFEITSAKDYSWAFTGGIGLQYDISPCIGLKVSGDYTYSRMIFAFRTAGETRYDKRNISFVNVVLGLVVIL